ncbi:MAG: DUF4293 domain-containing protein [Saprospiraceae bacterium]|nr:DUF4293 domain-containing protein [Saprospiraceae bacterium]
MIQRIQTLWLFLAGVCFLAQWKPGMELASTPTEGLSVFADKIYFCSESYVVLIGSGVSGILALIAIFLYNERVMQILLVAVSSLIQMIMGIGIPFYIINKAGKINQFEPGMGLWLSGLGLFLCWLATRSIRKDDTLIKSMDRLR